MLKGILLFLIIMLVFRAIVKKIIACIPEDPDKEEKLADGVTEHDSSGVCFSCEKTETNLVKNNTFLCKKCLK